jgi:hypothetical protein
MALQYDLMGIKFIKLIIQVLKYDIRMEPKYHIELLNGFQ